MSVNTLFTTIGLFLIAVYLLFRPSEAMKETEEEVAQLELHDFSLYDVSSEGLNSVLKASYGKKYTDRYEAADVNFSDTSQAEPIAMQAVVAHYKDHRVKLSQDVHYRQGDDFLFVSDEATYDQNRSVATTEGAFEIFYGAHRISGEKLFYDAARQKASAAHIDGTFVLNN